VGMLRNHLRYKLANKVRHNPKSFYGYVRSIIIKYVIGPIRAENGKLITDNGEICNVLTIK
jgi:hypothetical protein